MILHDSFSTALAAAHRRDLLDEAVRYRTARSAARARVTSGVRRPDPPAVTPAGEGNATTDCRYAVSR